jgi:uncharacterized phiE125 gp8 family phage protein
MSSILLTAPAVEPVSLAEAKAFLRVEHDDDNDVIAALVAGARIQVETQTRRALIMQDWRLVFDAWPPSGRIEVRPAPLRTLNAARIYVDDNDSEAIDLDSLIVDTAGSALVFPSWAMRQPGRVAAGIELDVSVGYGAAGSDVPEPLRQAIRLLIAHWYENRGVIVAGQSAAAVLPASVPALLAPYRMVAL